MEQNISTTGGISAALRDQLHECENVCERLEKLAAGSTSVEDYPGAVKSLCDEFEAKCTLPPEYAEILRRRFDEAKEAAKIGELAAANAKREAASRLDECAALSRELDQLIAAGDLVTLGEVRKLESRWVERLKAVDPVLADAAGFESRLAPLRARLEAEEAVENQKVDQVNALTARLEALMTVEDVNAAQEAKKAIEAEFAAIDLPPKRAVDAYRASLHKVASKIGQFYETLDLARWESFTLKGDLCAELEKLVEAVEADLPAAAKRLRELREKWKTLGSVPRAHNEEINARYLEASRKLQHRIDEYYADARQKHREAAEAKKALCEQAAALAGSTDWGSSAAAFKELQAKWKDLPGAGSAEKALFTAFRASADQFFNARKAHFDERNAKFDAMPSARRS
ncbi:MAG: DUF349 domain-containing protein [Victivallaceae bacterium]|nr:DUF349 domain-containing protein [Victivallaceae bacterium]